jgi:RNA polymerase sigma-70 factor (ECF subfamily)
MIDPERLSALFDAHAAQAVLYARQWLDRAAAEDVVQEVFVRLMLQEVLPVNVKAWLFKAVRNEAICQARSSSRRRRREQDGLREAWFEPDHAGAVDAAAASESLQTLPLAQREVIVLRIWGQLTLKEVAAVVGSATSTVFDEYRAGITALREQMGEPCQNKNV